MTAVSEDVDVVEEVDTYLDTDDGEQRHTHIVNPPIDLHIWKPDMDVLQDIVYLARVYQIKIRALCGKEFVPNRNPDKYSACPECIDIAHGMISERGE